jgi:hypothetical protein
MTQKHSSYAHPFSGSQVITIPASVHGFAQVTTQDVCVYNAKHPRQDITGQVAITVDADTAEVTVDVSAIGIHQGRVVIKNRTPADYAFFDHARPQQVLDPSNPFRREFVNRTTVTIPGSLDGYPTTSLAIQSSPSYRHATLDPQTFDIVLSFPYTTTGEVLIWSLVAKDTP